MDKEKILHIVKQIVHIEKSLNVTIDKLLDELGITREEVINESSNWSNNRSSNSLGSSVST